MISKRNNMNAVVRYHGRYYGTTSAVFPIQTFQLNPLALDARLVTVSDAFQEFRFTGVRVRLVSIPTGVAAVAYTPAIISPGPGAIANLENLEDVAYGNGQYGSPLPSLHLARRQLLSAAPVKWYRRGTAYDDTLESQGSIYVGSGSNLDQYPITFLIDYDIEFRAMADTALTARNARRVSSDPIASLEAKVADLQSVMSMTANPAHQVALHPQLPTPTQCDVPKSEYVLVRRPA